MINKFLLSEEGMPPHLRTRQDYVTWLKVLEKIDYAYAIDRTRPYLKYRLNSNSISFNKAKVAKIQWSIYRKELHLPKIKTWYYFISYMILGVLKRFKQTTLK